MELPLPIVTAVLTIVGGALTFVLGQIFIRLLLDPVTELKREIGKIAYSLDFYANRRYNGTEDEIKETRKVFRQHACRLQEQVNVIVGYKFWQFILRLPPLKDVFLASNELIGHSNFPSEPGGADADRSPDICRLLRIIKLSSIVSKK